MGPPNPNVPEDVSAVVLAGGRSRRMGRDKAGLRLGGRTLLGIMVEVLHGVAAEVLVASGVRRGDEPPGFIVVEDAFSGGGPLAGIHAGLCACSRPRLLVVPCDLPLLEPALLRALCREPGDFDLIVPSSQGGPEPLVAVLGRNCVAEVGRLLESGERRVGSLRSAPGLKVRVLPPEWAARHDPSGDSFTNVNDEESFARAAAALAARRRPLRE